ncbi:MULTISPECIES: helix-turn-helix transcriptional regulator [Glutamicibacter]|uniref:ArsR family transcriptional regulator n=1 Tax=Glutamicibacter mysorens TaxID=257984 RepID=A0ABX4MW20_9MICC|nr:MULTISPECIES: transcriptional regulator [Glutamicibacter]PJJ43518.1 putative ArsR family transcriptional regulator [Glutamicibacter mysorens]QEP06912.1 transcriptional regulator [Glutamicibacter sp. ZJUTW]
MSRKLNLHQDAVIKSLNDPVRRQLFEFISQSTQPVGREAAAKAAGISRTLAAYHLDRLATAGLLAVTFARPEGRTGPGAGRTAKLYALAQSEVSVSLPARNYRLLGSLLAQAASADTSGAVLAALHQAARGEGRKLGQGGDGLVPLLDELGYEPEVDEHGEISMRNCPFHQVAQQQTEMVCSMNYELVSGALEGCQLDCGRAELSPQSGRCCIVVHPH